MGHNEGWYACVLTTNVQLPSSPKQWEEVQHRFGLAATGTAQVQGFGYKNKPMLTPVPVHPIFKNPKQTQVK